VTKPSSEWLPVAAAVRVGREPPSGVATTFRPAIHRILARAGGIVLVDVRGGTRAMMPSDRVRSTLAGLVVGPPVEGSARRAVRSLRRLRWPERIAGVSR
jgi:hypothetical protein